MSHIQHGRERRHAMRSPGRRRQPPAFLVELNCKLRVRVHPRRPHGSLVPAMLEHSPAGLPWAATTRRVALTAVRTDGVVSRLTIRCSPRSNWRSGAARRVSPLT